MKSIPKVLGGLEHGPFEVFGGTHDVSVSRSDLDAWSSQTTAEAQVVVLAGTHFFIETSGSDLLRHIRPALD